MQLDIGRLACLEEPLIERLDRSMAFFSEHCTAHRDSEFVSIGSHFGQFSVPSLLKSAAFNGLTFKSIPD
jgi:hypothetical protein